VWLPRNRQRRTASVGFADLGGESRTALYAANKLADAGVGAPFPIPARPAGSLIPPWSPSSRRARSSCTHCATGPARRGAWRRAWWRRRGASTVVGRPPRGRGQRRAGRRLLGSAGRRRGLGCQLAVSVGQPWTLLVDRRDLPRRVPRLQLPRLRHRHPGCRHPRPPKCPPRPASHDAQRRSELAARAEAATAIACRDPMARPSVRARSWAAASRPGPLSARRLH
jgi:hypothetical protein